MSIRVNVLTAIGLMMSVNAVATEVAPSVTANDFINLFEKLSGKHPGYRKAHAKGICLSGTFLPGQKKEYANFTDSAIFAEPTAILIRFSVGGGNPATADTINGPRGMAIQFKRPDGTIHNIAGLSTPVFPGETPEDFFGLLTAGSPDKHGKRDIAKLNAYKDAHPATKSRELWAKNNPKISAAPYSYQNAFYYGIHTFFFTKGEQLQKFRWSLEPVDGFKALANKSSTNSDIYLTRLSEQLKKGDIRFNWLATIGQTEDTNINPSVVWPKERPQITLGQIQIVKFSEACDIFTFDPTILSSGFKISDDPVLKIRSPAYAISFGKRLSNQ